MTVTLNDYPAIVQLLYCWWKVQRIASNKKQRLMKQQYV